MELLIGFIVVVAAIALVWGIAQYNVLVRLRNLIEESWRQIDVELQRRHDLIPNLVETVKGYAAHERETLEAVTAARTAAVVPGQSPAAQAETEGMLVQALNRLFALSENYPQLQASPQFMELQNELTNTEDRVAAGRRFYNANVRTSNIKIETFPTLLIANMFGFKRAEYFEVADATVRQVPTVEF